MQAPTRQSQRWNPLLTNILKGSLTGLALATSIVGNSISDLLLLNSTNSYMAIASTTIPISPQAQQSPQLPLHSLLTTNHTSTTHSSAPHSSTTPAQSTLQSGPSSIIPISQISQPLADGTYIYGQSPEPNTADSVYLVFDVNGYDLVGAFYMPHSSFDCFRGSVEANELTLTIRDSYDQTTFAHSVSLVAEGAIAATNITTTVTRLEGFYRIDTFNETAQHVLSICRTETW